MSKPVILRNAAGDTPELWFYTEFGPDMYDCISADAVRDALSQMGSQRKLNLHINSEGGDVTEACAIYTLLKNCGSKINVMIDGIALSCASWVAQVGDSVCMAENGLMMIHDPETACYGNEADLTRAATMMGQVKQSILSVYAARATKTTPDQLSAAMSAETWYTAQQAMDAGLVDSIDPNKSIAVNAVKREFRNAPGWLKNQKPGGDEWRRLNQKRLQLLNELDLKV